jgi:hypothetical protein
MIIHTFKYTKSDGSESKRVLATVAVPSKFYHGVDISELSTEDQALYITEIDRAKTEYAKQVLAIHQKYDLCNRYRQFDPNKMTELAAEDI